MSSGTIEQQEKAATAAEAFLAREHPDFQIRGTSVRAAEQDRFVFAVFYSYPGWRGKPSLYSLVAVLRATNDVVEIHPAKDSPYWIHGRK